MSRFIKSGGLVMNVMNKIMYTAILNLCFLLGCLPVITIGASATALYSVNLKMVRDEESYVFSSFWKAYRDNLKQGVGCWLLLLCAGAGFLADFLIIRELEGITKVVLSITTIVLFIIYLIILQYIFPYMARFHDKLGTCIKNALMIGGTHMGYTVGMFMITALAVILTVYSLSAFLRMIFVWMVGGFSLLSYANSFFIRKIFERYEE